MSQAMHEVCPLCGENLDFVIVANRPLPVSWCHRCGLLVLHGTEGPAVRKPEWAETIVDWMQVRRPSKP